MNEPETTETERLSGFFRERLLPIADQARRDGVEIFPLGPESEADSYFLSRASGESYIHTIDRSDLAGELHKLWATDRLAGMDGLAGPIVELAESLRETDADPDDVSPFIYAMF